MENIPLHKPNFNKKITLNVVAITPHSVCPDSAGLYYFTSMKLSKTALLGMLENAMGWHLDYGDLYKKKDQIDPRKEWERLYRKLHKIPKGKMIRKIEFSYSSNNKSKRTFSILSHYINSIKIKGQSQPICADVQIAHRRRGPKNPLTISRFSSKSLGMLHDLDESYNDGLPFYYTKPIRREYIAQSVYQVEFCCDDLMSTKLKQAILNPSAPIYIGHSEGWAELEFVSLSNI